jgi:hypothetical protein
MEPVVYNPLDNCDILRCIFLLIPEWWCIVRTVCRKWRQVADNYFEPPLSDVDKRETICLKKSSIIIYNIMTGRTGLFVDYMSNMDKCGKLKVIYDHYVFNSVLIAYYNIRSCCADLYHGMHSKLPAIVADAMTTCFDIIDDVINDDVINDDVINDDDIIHTYTHVCVLNDKTRYMMFHACSALCSLNEIKKIIKICGLSMYVTQIAVISDRVELLQFSNQKMFERWSDKLDLIDYGSMNIINYLVTSGHTHPIVFLGLLHVWYPNLERAPALIKNHIDRLRRFLRQFKPELETHTFIDAHIAAPDRIVDINAENTTMLEFMAYVLSCGTRLSNQTIERLQEYPWLCSDITHYYPDWLDKHE